MNTIASGLSYLDLEFQGMPNVIATAVVHGPGGVALIDPGPSSSLPVLRRELERGGITMDDVTAILLTHIHLDHAGATGTLVHENPRLRVFVHEKGAPHLIDPAKLVASAARLYGDAMDRLWGEIRPVPSSAVTVLTGGERITVARRDLEVAYTPGHASHHVSYFNEDTGVAFVGDTAGVRVLPRGPVLSPTPPPDIDLEAWRESLALIERRRPHTLFLTHFGTASPVGPHLRELSDHLELTSGLVKTSLGMEGSDEIREQWFTEEVRRELLRRTDGVEAQIYEMAGPFVLNWRGLARYWRKKGG